MTRLESYRDAISEKFGIDLIGGKMLCDGLFSYEYNVARPVGVMVCESTKESFVYFRTKEEETGLEVVSFARIPKATTK